MSFFSGPFLFFLNEIGRSFRNFLFYEVFCFLSFELLGILASYLIQSSCVSFFLTAMFFFTPPYVKSFSVLFLPTVFLFHSSSLH